MEDILIMDINSDRIVVAFENSSGQLEYNTYQQIDGGITDIPECDIGAVLANDLGITEYQDYKLEIIE